MECTAEADTWVGSAPGKVILFGEHAVVYGQPAIAVPVTGVQARATVTGGEAGSGVWLVCCDLPPCEDRGLLPTPDGGAPASGCRYALRGAAADDPLRGAVALALARFSDPERGISGTEPDIVLTITSTIPIARGLGSGAAVATAVIRSLAAYFGRQPSNDEVSGLVFEVEKLFHGTPSGIDNTVIAYQQPVYFVRGEGMTPLRVGSPFSLVIADSGAPSSTREVVGTVRQRWHAEPQRYDALFDSIGAIARIARRHIETGDWRSMAGLMDENQALLEQMGVSSPALDRLIEAARSAGAVGAKLSGAGRGGCILAAAERHAIAAVSGALRLAGAAQVLVTEVA